MDIDEKLKAIRSGTMDITKNQPGTYSVLPGRGDMETLLRQQNQRFAKGTFQPPEASPATTSSKAAAWSWEEKLPNKAAGAATGPTIAPEGIDAVLAKLTPAERANFQSHLQKMIAPMVTDALKTGGILQKRASSVGLSDVPNPKTVRTSYTPTADGFVVSEHDADGNVVKSWIDPDTDGEIAAKLKKGLIE
jgi:hypothetical protein